MMPHKYAGVRAPEFPPGMEWFNVPAPLSLQALRGKFVLLDFWTYCCINCLHIIPELKRLEAQYPEELVVIGVHSAKFPHERAGENIRQAILRYGIEHPVVNDPDFYVWEQYTVHAWPTVYIIDPKGYIVGHLSGEGVYAPLDRVLRELIPIFEAEQVLSRRPVDVHAAPEGMAEQMLRFPGKVTVHAETNRLFISDTGHHRLLVADLEGRVLQQIGSGEAGLRDGSFDEAAFRAPQGTALDPLMDILYVADTENHALRRVFLRQGRVETLAGNGTQAQFGMRHATGPASPLNSPWDLLLHDGRLYVAMAGPHQLWLFDPRTGEGEVYAGSGYEHLVDGPRQDAQLAQPSGLTTDGTILYFADSETSALRRVGIGRGEDARVETLIGEGLFAFGDVDGGRPEARLQHPLGVAWAEDAVYVTDTYNHKIKRYRPAEGTVTTLAGTGAAGWQDGAPGTAQFYEPGGLAAAGGRLFVADTNNHQVRVVTLATGAVHTLPVHEAIGGRVVPSPAVHPPVRVAPGTGGVRVLVAWPEGYKPNARHPGQVRATSSDPAVARPRETDPQRLTDGLLLPHTFAAGTAELELAGEAFVCDEANGRCLMQPFAVRVPVEAVEGAAPEVTIHLTVHAPAA